MALLNGQSMGIKSELHQNPKLTDPHWQLIKGLKSQITRPAKPMVICAKLHYDAPIRLLQRAPDQITRLVGLAVMQFLQTMSCSSMLS